MFVMPLLKCLIVDDDVLGRELTLQYLDGVASCGIASIGCEATELFEAALDSFNLK
jgi:hypothetical protein